jgi:hypothetical protein
VQFCSLQVYPLFFELLQTATASKPPTRASILAVRGRVQAAAATKSQQSAPAYKSLQAFKSLQSVAAKSLQSATAYKSAQLLQTRAFG